MNSHIKTKRLLYKVILKRLCYLEQAQSNNPLDRCIVVKGSRGRGKRELMKQLADNKEEISCYIPLSKYRVLNDFKALLRVMSKRHIKRYFIDGLGTTNSACDDYLHKFIQNSGRNVVFVLTVERTGVYNNFVEKYSDIRGKFTFYRLGCTTYAETLLFNEYKRLEKEHKTKEAKQLSIKDLFGLTDMTAFYEFFKGCSGTVTGVSVRRAMHDRLSMYCTCKPLENGNSCIVMSEYVTVLFGAETNKFFDVVSVCLDDIETTRKYGVYERPNGLLDATYRLRDWIVTCNNANACKLERRLNGEANYLSSYDVYRLDIVWLAVELAYYVYCYQVADKENCVDIMREGKDKPSIVQILHFCGLDNEV